MWSHQGKLASTSPSPSVESDVLTQAIRHRVAGPRECVGEREAVQVQSAEPLAVRERQRNLCSRNCHFFIEPSGPAGACGPGNRAPPRATRDCRSSHPHRRAVPALSSGALRRNVSDDQGELGGEQVQGHQRDAVLRAMHQAGQVLKVVRPGVGDRSGRRFDRGSGNASCAARQSRPRRARSWRGRAAREPSASRPGAP